jgi:hypothetical protein
LANKQYEDREILLLIQQNDSQVQFVVQFLFVSLTTVSISEFPAHNQRTYAKQEKILLAKERGEQADDYQQKAKRTRKTTKRKLKDSSTKAEARKIFQGRIVRGALRPRGRRKLLRVQEWLMFNGMEVKGDPTAVHFSQRFQSQNGQQISRQPGSCT